MKKLFFLLLFSNSVLAQVGINTLTPTSTLDVNGQVTIDQKNFGGYGGLLIKGDSPFANYPNITFSTLNDSGNDEIAAYIGGAINNNTTGSESMDINFLTSTNGLGGLSERIRIKDNGNVGIGNSNPAYILDISNRMRIRSGGSIFNSSGLWLNNSINTYEATFIGIDEFENVGFYGNTGAGWGMVMKTNNGNIGIGNQNPNAPLQFANTITNRKIVLYEGANNDHQYYGFGINGGTLRYQTNTTADNHVFFAGVNSTTSNELMSIKGNGDVKINNLAGFTNKPVSVESDGTLKIDNLVRYYCLNNFDFKDEGPTSTSTFISGDASLFSTYETGTPNSKKMAATVHIPDGATIVSITGYALDNSATGNISFSIYKLPNTGGLQGIFNNNVTTSGASTAIQSITNTAILETINNQTGNYVVFASFTGTTWDSINTKIKSFVIGYRFN